MRWYFWLCSLALHAGAMGMLLHSDPFILDEFPMEPVYMVDLVQLAPEPGPAPEPPAEKVAEPEPEPEPEALEPDPAPAPEPEPVEVEPDPATEPEPVETEPAPQEAPAPSAPEASPPPPAVDPPPTIAEAPAEPGPSAPVAPAGPAVVIPEARSGVADLSPVKRSDVVRRHTPPQPSARPDPKFTKENTIVIRNEGADKYDTLKHGSELRFMLRQYAHEDFTLAEDYAGLYTFTDGRRALVVHCPTTYDGLLFFDTSSGLLSHLSQFGQMMYTYGPTFGQAKPVVGSLTFFPVKYHEEYAASQKAGTIMWLPPDPPMQWGRKVRFAESLTPLALHEKTRDAAGKVLHVRVAGVKPHAVVVWHDPHLARHAELMHGFWRLLAEAGVGVDVPLPPEMMIAEDNKADTGRQNNEAQGTGSQEMTGQDALLTALHLTRDEHPDLPVGVWTHMADAATGLELGAEGRAPDFVVASSPHMPAAGVYGLADALSRSDIPPQLWLLGPGVDAVRAKNMEFMLQTLYNDMENGLQVHNLSLNGASGAPWQDADIAWFGTCAAQAVAQSVHWLEDNGRWNRNQ